MPDLPIEILHEIFTYFSSPLVSRASLFPMESLVLLDAFDLLEKIRDRMGLWLLSQSSSRPIRQDDPSFLSQSYSRGTVFYLIVQGRCLPPEEGHAMDTKGSSRSFKAVRRGIHSIEINGCQPPP